MSEDFPLTVEMLLSVLEVRDKALRKKAISGFLCFAKFETIRLSKSKTNLLGNPISILLKVIKNNCETELAKIVSKINDALSSRGKGPFK